MSINTVPAQSKKSGGIRLAHLNILLVIAGLIIAAVMVYSTYQTSSSVSGVLHVTDAYLHNQQTGGMLRDLSGGMSEQAAAFVRSGEPGLAGGYFGQKGALAAQLALYTATADEGSEADKAYQQALQAYRFQNAADEHAMRLFADTLPAPVFAALPPALQEVPLTPEEKELSPEEKNKAALALLGSEDYRATGETIRAFVDLSHRLSSEEATAQAENTSVRIASIVSEQKLLVLLFLLLGAAAFLINHWLLLSRLRHSIGNLDRREPIPERGCREIRHLAEVYNAVLKDNQEKTERLSYTATHDALTGLINRADFDRIFGIVESDQIGLVVADVDHFKQYNDDYGHDAGDRVLGLTSEALSRHFRPQDHICRIGGDEFCIIMPGLCHADGSSIAERVKQINQDLASASDDLPPITISVGVAFWNRPNPSGSIFKDADSALMELKKTRNGCCAVYCG